MEKRILTNSGCPTSFLELRTQITNNDQDEAGESMKIAIFGSAFNPPHKGHEFIYRTLLEFRLVDEVWLLPAKDPAFSKSRASNNHRLAMLKLILEPRVKIELYEIECSSVNNTYSSLLAIQRQNPELEFSFVIGADKLNGFNHWVMYAELLERFRVWVFPRCGFELSPLYKGMHVISEVECLDVSSTLVREFVKADHSLDGLVGKQIGNYIVKHGLYV